MRTSKKALSILLAALMLLSVCSALSLTAGAITVVQKVLISSEYEPLPGLGFPTANDYYATLLSGSNSTLELVDAVSVKEINGSGEAVAATAPFVAGKTYELELKIHADSGFVFTSTVSSCKLNGETAEFQYESSSRATVTYRFTAEFPTSGYLGDNVTWSYNPTTKHLTISGTGPTYDYAYSGKNCTPLKKSGVRTVTINDGVTYLGKNLFSYCNTLESITIPNSVTSIGEGAFRSSTLTSVIIPGSVTTVSEDAFAFCTNLSSVILRSGVTAIGQGAFHYCSKLQLAEFPTTLENVAYAAFEDCRSLSDIYYKGNEAQWNGIQINTDDVIDENEPENKNIALFNATKHFSANLEEILVNVIATVLPAGAGSTSGTGAYTAGAAVTLSTTPSSGYRFTGWTLNGTQVSDQLSFTQTFNSAGSYAYTANYTQDATSYSVTATATEGGTVSGLDESSYVAGTPLLLIASANNGYRFTGWYSGSTKVSEEARYRFYVVGSVSLTAHFEELPKYTLTVTASPAAGGTVTGGGQFPEGWVHFGATPNEGYYFCGWYAEDKLVDSSSQGSMKLEKDCTVTARFASSANLIPLAYGPEGLKDGEWYLDLSAWIDLVSEPGFSAEAKQAQMDAIKKMYAFSFDTSNGFIVVRTETQDGDKTVFVYTCLSPDCGEQYNTFRPLVKQYQTPASSSDDNANRCHWCGKTHEGFFQKIIGFFHSILATLFGKKY